MSWFQARNMGQGALSGAATGASIGGPWGALAGAGIGALAGALVKKPKTAAEMGLTPFDAMEEAQKWVTDNSQWESQRNSFNATNNQNIDEYAKQLISSGMNPQQAYIIAQNKMGTNINKFEQSQQQAMNDQTRQLGMSLLGRQFDREDEITSYDNAMSTRPSFGAQAGLLGAGVNLMRAGEGNNYIWNWANGKFGSDSNGE